MTDQSRPREPGHAIAAGLSEREKAEYERPQEHGGRGDTETVGRARPLEFDGNGFPVAQCNPSFVTRVARLLNLL
jgi:hypothetical protein